MSDNLIENNLNEELTVQVNKEEGNSELELIVENTDFPIVPPGDPNHGNPVVPGGLIPPPIVPYGDPREWDPRYRNIGITGKVIDFVTTKVATGLTVCACYRTDTDNLRILGSATTKNDGTYFLNLEADSVGDFTPPFELEITVYSAKNQLTSDKQNIVIVDSFRKNYMSNINAFTLPSVKGVVKRKNNMPATNCLVELYNDNLIGTESNYILGSAITNIKGEYEISYTPDASGNSSNLRLGFYNNEDIVKTQGKDVKYRSRSSFPIDVNEVIIENEPVTEEPYIGDIMFNEFGDRAYEVTNISKTDDGWNITKNLKSITDNDEHYTTNWTVYYDSNVEGWFRIPVIKISTQDKYKGIRTINSKPYLSSGEYQNYDSTESYTYKVTNEKYKISTSPLLITNNRLEIVNFKFISDSLDLYTRIIRRENELIPQYKSKSKYSENIPVRQFGKAYKKKENPFVALLTGVAPEDVEILNQARSFNSGLKLDLEDIIFGLIKNGVKANIESIFSISTRVLISKINKAVDDKVIPEQPNVLYRLDKLKDKIFKLYNGVYKPFFEGIKDLSIIEVENNKLIKYKFIKRLLEYRYEDKKIDNEFWTILNLSTYHETALRLFVKYGELCGNDNTILNHFVANGHFKPINYLLQLRRKEIPFTETLRNQINKRIEELHPTRSLLLRLANSSLSLKNDLFDNLKKKLISIREDSSDHFFDLGVKNGKEFNICKDKIRDYLEVNSTIFDDFFVKSGGTKEDWLKFLTIIQRVYSLTKDNNFESVVALIANNYYSAYDVVMAGRTKFNTKTISVLNADNQKFIFNAAELKVNKVLAMLNKYSSSTNSALPSNIKNSNSIGNGVQLLTLPDMKVLFGDQNITDTKHGDSVLSPAAYLVDILNLLKKFKINDSNNLFDLLKQRRPDIDKIPLNCANAITPIPYIDLVIEILESAIIKPGNEDVFNTTKDADELKTNPEYCNYAVYDKIKESNITSWNHRPFDMVNEEMKIYSQALGINRSKLAESFTGIEGCVNPYFDILGFTNKDIELFSQSTTLPFLNELVSEHITNNVKQYRVDITNFLDKTSMHLDYLEMLLSSYYVNPLSDGERTTIHFEKKLQLANAYLEFIGKEQCFLFLTRMYQFQRLLEATKWSVSVLDSVLINNSDIFSSVSDPDITNPKISNKALESVGKAKMMQISLNITDSQLSKLLGKVNLLEYANETNAFNKLFIENNLSSKNKEKLKQVLSGQSKVVYVFEYKNPNLINPLSPFAEFLCKKLDLKESVFRKILFLFEEVDEKLVITEESIARLFLAKKLIQLMNNDAYLFALTCKKVQKVNGSTEIIFTKKTDLYDVIKTWFINHLNKDQIEYVNGDTTKIVNINLSPEEIEDYINSIYDDVLDSFTSVETSKMLDYLTYCRLHEALNAVVMFDENDNLTEFSQYICDSLNISHDDIKRLSSELGKVINNKSIDLFVSAYELMEIINIGAEDFVNICKFTKSGDPEIKQILSNKITDSKKLVDTWKFLVSNKIDINELLFLLGQSTDNYNGCEEKLSTLAKNLLSEKIALGATLAKEDSKFKNPIQEIKLDNKSKEAIKTYIYVGLLKLTGEEESNIEKYSTIKGYFKLNEYILNNVTCQWNEEEQLFQPTDRAINDVLTILKKIYKALLIYKMFDINDKEIENIDIKTLPVNIYDMPVSANEKEIHFSDFKKLATACIASRYLKKGKNPFNFLSLIQSSPSNIKANLYNYIDFSVMLQLWKHNQMLLDDKYNTDLQWLIDVGEIYNHLKKCNILPEEALNLIITDDISADSIRLFVDKTKKWLNKDVYQKVVGEERNKLRIKQRDALVQYILEIDNGRTFKDDNDLFSYFLIDTQMTPAVNSSRIVQATLAIQLLVQRIQMNLEPNVTIDNGDERKWQWMSLYRVWEANRKIFLYPENWIEPELRDDKSPFFKELEKELTSNEITKESIEKNFAGYISNVAKVANIEVCQMYNEEIDSYSTLHVIGRTRFEPKEYFYRTLVNKSYWTPWEKMGIEINTEHIAPVVINDRLVVFWLEFFDEAKEPLEDDLKEDSTIKKAQKQYRIQICWSEYVDKKWSQKKFGNNDVFVDYKTGDEQANKLKYRLVYEVNCITNKTEIDKAKENEKPAAVIANCLHVIAPKSIISASFGVECYNHILVTRKELFCGQSYRLTRGLRRVGQKIMTSTEFTSFSKSNWMSLPVMSTNGTAVIHNVIENNNGLTTLVYPHQYPVFYCNSPFIVENGTQSIIFIPSEKANNNNIIDTFVPVLDTVLDPILDDDQEIGYLGDCETVDHEDTLHHDFTDRDSNMTYQKNLPCNNTRTFVSVDRAQNNDSSRNAPIVAPGLTENPNMPQFNYSYKPVINAYLGYLPFMENLRRSLEVYGVEGVLNSQKKPLMINNQEKMVSIVTVTQNKDYSNLYKQQSNIQYLTDFEMNSEVIANVLADSNNSDYNMKYIAEKFEYNLNGAYSIYNWEMFFHVPYLISNRYFVEGNYDEALKWMHFIFDPRISEGHSSAKYWKFKPFADYNATEGIDDILSDLKPYGSNEEKDDIDKQIENWSNDPFKPHNIARIRINAYMKAIIMRYIDIIIARGDESFRLDTMESINESLQYYVIAAQLLGKKPEVLETSILDAKPYSKFNSNTFGNAIESFEEALIKPENAAYLERFVESNEIEIASKPSTKDSNQKDMVTSIFSMMDKSDTVEKLYFGIPKNDKMFSYWDKVADRLFKIRNSLNIDGVSRKVSLFAPPIDPGLLVKATAAGLNIMDIVKGKDGNKTQYRFQTLLQRSLEICSEVKSLGAGLLSALEKRDNEKLSKLRAGNELVLIEKLTQIKAKNKEEAINNIDHLKSLKDSVVFREKYYRGKKKISKKEQQQQNLMESAMKLQVASQGVQLVSNILGLTPDITAGAAGVWGSPFFNIKHGGYKLSKLSSGASQALGMLSSIKSHEASVAGINAGYDRRFEDWMFQADVAKRELEQMDKQILSAEIRKEISELDMNSHLVQIQQTKDSYEILKTKFSNEDLYMWMASRISELYRSAFDMAYVMAKQAESAYNFELCPHAPKMFITNNHFNADKKGLLAGESLYMEIKKMEAEYLTDHKRKHEITKHISLAMLDPEQIIKLRTDGTCNINIPELLFDMDYPGHYNRRIKSVSLTIPSITGSYTSLSASLSLTENKYKKQDGKTHNVSNIATSAISTSNAINDSGMFEFNFNDARYLPFEGAGVDTVWTLSLPNQLRQFDYNSISDVIMHVNYMSEGSYSKTAEDKVIEVLNAAASGNTLTSIFSLKAQYPDAWAKIGKENVSIDILKSQLPYFLQGRTFSDIAINFTRITGNITLDKPSAIADSKQIFNFKATFEDTECTNALSIEGVSDMPDDIIIQMNYKVSGDIKNNIIPS